MTIAKAIAGDRIEAGAKLLRRAAWEGECMVWTGARNDAGYGQIVHEGRVWYAHRLAYAIVHGPIPDGMYVCHTCDNPPCIRAEHLFLGSNADNQRDALAKGRRPVGERHHNAKLTPTAVRAIRARYAASGVSQRRLAAEYGVGQDVISRIVSGRGWRSVA